VIPQSSALKIENLSLKIQVNLILHSGFLFIRDRGGIQTPNPQSRNLMRYSVAPRGQLIPIKQESVIIFN
jgi:hypothetical protein